MGYIQALIRDCVEEHSKEGRKYYKEALIHIRLRDKARKVIKKMKHHKA